MPPAKVQFNPSILKASFNIGGSSNKVQAFGCFPRSGQVVLTFTGLTDCSCSGFPAIPSNPVVLPFSINRGSSSEYGGHWQDGDTTLLGNRTSGLVTILLSVDFSGPDWDVIYFWSGLDVQIAQGNCFEGSVNSLIGVSNCCNAYSPFGDDRAGAYGGSCSWVWEP